MHHLRQILKFLLPLLLLSGCIDFGNEGPAPLQRPRGYFRISTPEKNYKKYDSTCPFTAEIPAYTMIRHAPDPGASLCWLNWYFPQYKATVHLTYDEVEGDIDTLISTSLALTEKHIIKADSKRDSLINIPGKRVYGNIIDLGGDAASQVQFYLTDSTKHFLRGALYFYARPNADSIAPVLDFVRDDIFHFAQSLNWK